MYIYETIRMAKSAFFLAENLVSTENFHPSQESGIFFRFWWSQRFHNALFQKTKVGKEPSQNLTHTES